MSPFIVRASTCIGQALLLLLASNAPAFAYMGPGAGLTALGSLVALVGAIALAVVGFLWYPLKRMFSRSKRPAAPPKDDKQSGRQPSE